MYNRNAQNAGRMQAGGPAYAGYQFPGQTSFQPGTYFAQSQKASGSEFVGPNQYGSKAGYSYAAPAAPQDAVLHQLLLNNLQQYDVQLTTNPAASYYINTAATLPALRHEGMQKVQNVPPEDNALYARHRSLAIPSASMRPSMTGHNAPPPPASAYGSAMAATSGAAMARKSMALPPRPPCRVAHTAASNSSAEEGSASTCLYGRYRQQRNPAMPLEESVLSVGNPLEDSLKRKVESSAEAGECTVHDDVMKRSKTATKLGQLIAQTVYPSESNSSETWLDCEESLDDDGDSCLTIHANQRHRPSPRSVCWAPSLLSVDCFSTEALARANSIISGLRIPGGIDFMPVQPTSYLYHMAIKYGFTAFSISLGSSYFQRLLEAIPQLRQAVQCHAKYSDYCAHIKDRSTDVKKGATAGVQESALQSILVTCVYLAQKVADSAPSIEVLRFMLSNLYGARVSRAQAYQVEIKCLEGLQWRMGPFFMEDEGLDD